MQSVSFCDDDSLHKIREFDMVEEFERPLIWWSMSDYNRFRSVCNKTVRVLETSAEEDDNQDQASSSSSSADQQQENPRKQQQHQESSFYCMRGLENVGSKAYRERRERIKHAVRLVIESQDFYDAFACAKLYQGVTTSTRIQAQVRGAQDEEAVLWERTIEEEELPQGEDKDKEDEEVQEDVVAASNTKDISKPSRLKRRRSSAGKKGGVLKSSAIGGGILSLKNFARKITLPSAA